MFAASHPYYSPMLTSAPNSLARRLRVPGYLFLGIAMILPVIDLFVGIYPFRLGQVVWRFGAVGLLSSAVGAPLLVLFFVFALALFAGDRKVVIGVGIVAALIALILIGGAGSFSLDALQMKRRVQAAAQLKYMMASGQALFKLLLEALSAIVLSISAFRAANAKALPVSPAEQRTSAGLVMGRRATGKVGPVGAPEAIPAQVDD